MSQMNQGYGGYMPENNNQGQQQQKHLQIPIFKVGEYNVSEFLNRNPPEASNTFGNFMGTPQSNYNPMPTLKPQSEPNHLPGISNQAQSRGQYSPYGQPSIFGAPAPPQNMQSNPYMNRAPYQLPQIPAQMPPRANPQMGQMPGMGYQATPIQPQVMQPNNYNQYGANYQYQLNSFLQKVGPGQQPSAVPPYYYQMMQLQKQQIAQKPKPKVTKSRSGLEIVEEAEEVDLGPSSEEAEFSEESETDYENFPDDYAPTESPVIRPTIRENRKVVKRENEDFFEEEEEIDEAFTELDADRIEHIYLSRVTESGLEYLVRFQESPPGLSQWIPESLLLVLPNSQQKLDRFRMDPYDISSIPEDSNIICPVAHRKDTPDSPTELLFRFFMESSSLTLFYWDFAKQDMLDRYFKNRIRVDIADPALPTGEIPPITNTTVASADGEEILRDYQVDGIKWLVQCWLNGHGSILADEMGLGKTIQLLAFLHYLNKYTDWHGPFLIAVRSNTFKQWVDEISKWTDLICCQYNSGPAQRSIIREYVFPYLDELGRPIEKTLSFNILLVSYDVFLKDVEYLDKYLWEAVIIDEGHRIKNSQGKKNNAFTMLNAKHRIILTGTPIQSTLEELYTLLRFVSPAEFNNVATEEEDNVTQEEQLFEDLSPEEIIETRNKIHPHLLRRSVAQVEHSIGPKEERVVFVTLTEPQRELIRLIKLHKLWRLRGVQISDELVDQNNEGRDIQKVCSHPFLIQGAEQYYKDKLGLTGLDLLLACSGKFQWLHHILKVLKREGRKVLIFCYRVELLHLLREYCNYMNYRNELLVGSMPDQEKAVSIDRFSDDKSDAFIFLISTRSGSEGLNLTVADTEILFEPDWNPQNDLQAQARSHRIGQTQKVDILRVTTYQTYEHEIFVRAQRKLALWLTLLGNENLDEAEIIQTARNIHSIRPPPPIPQFDDVNDNLDVLLSKISTVVTDFALEHLNDIEAPLKEKIDFGDGTPDDIFVERFPVQQDDFISRRKRSRSHDHLFDPEGAREVYNLLFEYGYNRWKEMAEKLDRHSEDQVRRFGVTIVIFAFRALTPNYIGYMPVLIKQLLIEEPDFKFEMLICTNKSQWSGIFPEEHDYSLEAAACRKLRDDLFNRAFEFLSVLEMKLIGVQWRGFNNNLDINTLPPPQTAEDIELAESIMDIGLFDPFKQRVQDIVNKMRADIIKAQIDDECGYKFRWWTMMEAMNVINVYKNFPVNLMEDVLLHTRTTILSKDTSSITIFARKFKKLLDKRQKGPLFITKNISFVKEAPQNLRQSKGFKLWTKVPPHECDEIVYRIELANLIKKRFEELCHNRDASHPTANWSDYHTKEYLRLLLLHGIDASHDILMDQRYPFRKFLNELDIEVLKNERQHQDTDGSIIPSFVFTEEDLFTYLNMNTPFKPKSNPRPPRPPSEKKERQKKYFTKKDMFAESSDFTDEFTDDSEDLENDDEEFNPEEDDDFK